MPTSDILSSVRSSLETIADSLDEVSFVIPSEGRAGGERARTAVVSTVRQYLLHRLYEPDAPVVAALVGLSGVGKSTLLNSLAQDRISAPGAVRPTTTNAVLWAHRDHAARYWTEFVGRVRDQVGPTADVVIGEDPLTKHLTFVDTPPLELTHEGTATTAAETLLFADLCIFVTSITRYADAAPVDFLLAARDRGIPILFVLNRVPEDPASRRDLLADFASKLSTAGLLPEPEPSFIFGVPEATPLSFHGGLGPEAVGSLRKELSEVSDPEFRIVVIDETADATVNAVAERAEAVATMLRAEGVERSGLIMIADDAYAQAARRINADIAAGEYADLSAHEVWAEASVDLTGVITRVAGSAAEETARAWISRPGGRALLEPGHEGLRRHGPDAARVTREQLDAWKDGLDDIAASGRRRIRRKRKMRTLVDDLWRAVFDIELEPRRWSGEHAAGIGRARELLSETIARALSTDAERFRIRLGAGIERDLPDRVIAAASYLRELPREDAAMGATTGPDRRG